MNQREHEHSPTVYRKPVAKDESEIGLLEGSRVLARDWSPVGWDLACTSSFGVGSEICGDGPSIAGLELEGEVVASSHIRGLEPGDFKCVSVWEPATATRGQNELLQAALRDLG